MTPGPTAGTETLIVAKQNAYGLTRDAALLADALARCGHGSCETVGISDRRLVDRLSRRKQAHRAIHIERAFPSWFSAADETWLIPNQERFPRRHVSRLSGVDLVLAKTRHAAERFEAAGAKTRYLGFTSPDRFDCAVEKNWHSFYHNAGASTLKGTEAVIAAWRRHPEWPTLHLVQKAANAPADVPSNVVLSAGYLPDDALRTEQNRHGIHLCPSRAEGWGHHLVEAMSCKALVLTTDAPPMNEHVTDENGVLVAWSTSRPRHLGTCYDVDADALEAAIEAILAMPVEGRAAMGRRARSAYEAIDADFHTRLGAIIRDKS